MNALASPRIEALRSLAWACLPAIIAGLGFMLVPDFTLGVDDSVAQDQPVNTDFFRQLWAGRFPLWSDAIECGLPLYARGSVLHPASVLASLVCQPLGIQREVEIGHILYLAFGTACASVFLRMHGCGLAAAAVGTLGFSLSGPFWGLWTNWNPYGFVGAMVPATLLAVDSTCRGRVRGGPIVGLALAGSVVTLICDPQMTIKWLLLTGGYAICRWPPERPLATATMLFVGGGLAGLMSLGQALPVVEYFRNTVRVSADGTAATDFYWMSLSVNHLLGLLNPLFMASWANVYGCAATFYGGTVYVGAMLGPTAGAWWRKEWWRDPVTRAISLLCVLYALLAIGQQTPLGEIQRALPIVNNMRWPVRWTMELCTLAPLAIGLACQQVIDSLPDRTRRFGMFWPAAAVCSLAAAAMFAIGPAGKSFIPPAWAGSGIGLPMLVNLAWAAWWLIPAGALAAVAAGSPRLFASVAIVGTLLGGCLAIPLAQTARFADLRNLREEPLRLDLPPDSRVLPLIDRSVELNLPRFGNYAFGLPQQFESKSVLGYGHPLRWAIWMKLFGPRGELSFPREACQAYLDPSRPGLLRLQRIGAVLAAPEDPLVVPLLEAHPDFERWKAFPELTVYRHTGFQEAAWFVERVGRIADQPRVSALMALDVTRDALVSDAGSGEEMTRYAGGNRVTAFREHNGRIDIDVTAPNDGFLVVNTTWYPGWQAWVDGRPGEVRRVDAAYMGVDVPAGSGHVQLAYQPAWILWLTGVCLFGWLVLVAIGLRMGWRLLT
jgi:hypothetical protein